MFTILSPVLCETVIFLATYIITPLTIVLSLLLSNALFWAGLTTNSSSFLTIFNHPQCGDFVQLSFQELGLWSLITGSSSPGSGTGMRS